MVYIYTQLDPVSLNGDAKMNIDQLLFNAEEEVIRKEIANLVETKELKIWAKRLNLRTHREVIARTTELREDIQ